MNRAHRNRFLVSALLGLYAASALAGASLQGFATLPANSLMPGPDSGRFLEQDAHPARVFHGQPAQGFSALLANPQGGFLALVDNGYGRRENSADFLLRIYFLEADFRTEHGGLGQILIEGYVELSDPSRHMPYRIVADRDCFPESDPCIETDRRIRSHRLLTGADLDPESLQHDGEGGFWVGDEFGPFLLHFSGDGVLREAPYAMAGLVSEGRPGTSPGASNLPRSRGFEGMARSLFGNLLLPMLEGAVRGDGPSLNIYRFDADARHYLDPAPDQPAYRYQLDANGTAIGAFKLFSEHTGLVLERDSGEGAEAQHKMIYRVDLAQRDEQGFVAKEPWVDLLNIDDPHDLDRDGHTRFRLPMSTIEGLAVIDRRHLVVITDNNFPFGSARGTRPEMTEMILLEVPDLW